MSDVAPTPLRDVRVVEISDRIAGAYCGKLLADAGADVVKAEPATGDVLRRYTATVRPDWGTDLTTIELSERVGAESDVKPALGVLRHADMVKFARSIPGANDAHADLDRARDWIAAYPAPPVVETEEKAA